MPKYGLVGTCNVVSYHNFFFFNRRFLLHQIRETRKIIGHFGENPEYISHWAFTKITSSRPDSSKLEESETTVQNMILTPLRLNMIQKNL